jgi:hypothetical protein
MSALQQLLDALRAARASREVSSIVLLISKAVESLLEGLVPGLQVEAEMLARFRDANLLVLKVKKGYSIFFNAPLLLNSLLTFVPEFFPFFKYCRPLTMFIWVIFFR